MTKDIDRWDDNKHKDLNKKISGSVGNLINLERKAQIDKMHGSLKFIDLTTLFLVFVGAVCTVVALEQNLYFVEIPEDFSTIVGDYFDNSTYKRIVDKGPNMRTVDFAGYEKNYTSRRPSELFNELKGLLYNKKEDFIIKETRNYCTFFLNNLKIYDLMKKVNSTFDMPETEPSDQKLTSVTPCFDDRDYLIIINRAVVSVCTLGVLITLVLRYNYLLNFNKIRMYLKPTDTIISSGYMKYLLLELFVNTIHSPPYVTSVINIPQRSVKVPAFVNMEVILSIMCLFLRSYHIFKYFSFHSRWYSYESERLCFECNIPLDSIFSIKAEFKEKPFVLVGITMLLSIFIFGYSLRCVEMFFMATSGQDWRYYWNGMWCVIITMATVGFGDFYPVSVLGRIIVVISCFWGTFLISLIVAAMTVAVEFNTQEAISYDSIKAAHFELKFGTEATILIQEAYRYKMLMRKADNTLNFQLAKSAAFQKLKNALESFRKLKKSKNDSIEAMIIELSVNKIEENLTVEMEKIKNQLKVVDKIKYLLDEYASNQELIKQKNLEIYKELQEMCIIKEKFS